MNLYKTAANHNQKYFMRQLNNLEKKSLQNPNSLEYKNPILYLLYGHILNFAKSYVDALGYYTKAYRLAPQDPLINLSLGLSHLQRGMQRRAMNRHEHIACGLTFIFQYHDLSGQTQESFYNVARAFHHIGLDHLAQDYYLKVCETDSVSKELNLSKEAAYNLSLLYLKSGSPILSRQILSRYCRYE